MIPNSLALAEARHQSLFEAYPRCVWKRFADGEELELSVVFPEGHSPEKRAPAVIFFHGGLWKMGDLTEFAPWALHFAKRGLVSFLVQYRQRQFYEVSAQDIFEDARDAWQWVHSQAASLGVNQDKILVAGSEAGGLMATSLFLSKKLVGKDKEESPKEGKGTPAACLLFRGLVDLGNKKLPLEDFFVSEKEKKAHSPSQCVRAGLPPLFWAVGGRDRLFPVAPVSKFMKAYERKNKGSMYVLLEESDASFYHFNAHVQAFEHTLSQAFEFLRGNGFIAGFSEDDNEVVI